MSVARKIKKGMRFVEYKDGREPFKVESVSIARGYATTSKGTRVDLDRLSSTKYYKAI